MGAAGADWDDCFVRERKDMLSLLGERDSSTGAKTLMFDQLPLLIMPDGTKVVQGAALIRHIGRSFGMYGASDAEATQIDVLLGGIGDFGNKCPGWPSPDARAGVAKVVAELESKWLERYAGAFEQQLSEVSAHTQYVAAFKRLLETVSDSREGLWLCTIGWQQRLPCRHEDLCC